MENEYQLKHIKRLTQVYGDHCSVEDIKQKVQEKIEKNCEFASRQGKYIIHRLKVSYSIQKNLEQIHILNAYPEDISLQDIINHW